MKITVKSGGKSGWADKHCVSDLCVAAGIASLRNRCHDKKFSVSPIITCSVNKRLYLFNTYYLFLMGGMNQQAKILRSEMIRRFAIDVKTTNFKL